MSDALVRTFVANQKHKERSKIIVSWRLVFFPVNLVLKILLAVAYFEISATAISTF
jgi:membrane-anchored protein YejM (alkaline phosphatase superfamily)